MGAAGLLPRLQLSTDKQGSHCQKLWTKEAVGCGSWGGLQLGCKITAEEDRQGGTPGTAEPSGGVGSLNETLRPHLHKLGVNVCFYLGFFSVLKIVCVEANRSEEDRRLILTVIAREIKRRKKTKKGRLFCILVQCKRNIPIWSYII